MPTSPAEERTYFDIPFDDKESLKLRARQEKVFFTFDFDGCKKWYVRGRQVPDFLKKYPVITPVAVVERKPEPTTFTEEQRAVIQYEPGPTEIVKCVALAGSGKTTSLVAFTKARPDKKCLYLAFNKSVAEEGKLRFSKNTSVMTIHALAYHWFPKEQQVRIGEGLKTPQIALALGLNINESGIRAHCARVEKCLQNYFISDDDEISEIHNPVKETADESSRIIEDSLTIWALIQDGTSPHIGIPFDASLKIYAIAKPTLDVDYILLDEGQDTNPVAKQIVLNQNKPTLVIGDGHQGIYQFRGAENALNSIDSHPNFRGKTFRLTISFRFGPHIANLANNILRHFKGEQETLKGMGKTPGRLLASTNPGWRLNPAKVENPLDGVDYTVITRSNSALFQAAYDAVEEIEEWEKMVKERGHTPPRLTLGFIGTNEKQKFSPLQSYKFGMVLDIYNVYAGLKDKVYSPYIRTFNSYEEIEEAAKDETSPDLDLVGPVSLINRHRSKIPGMIWKINDRSANPASEFCRVRLTTAHKAKGLEWNRVVLSDDYTPLVLERPAKGSNGAYPRLASLKETPPDEFNLLYMAVTRAKVDLKINEGLEHMIQFLRTAQAAA